MPNGKKQKQSYISKRREQKNVKPEGLKSTEIVGENINLSLNKKIYGNNAYDILNRDFSELIKPEKNISIEKLFDIYNDIFYSIPKYGNLSHESIILQSEDYFYNFVNPKEYMVDELLLEIEAREQVLTDLQTPSSTVSLFPEGTFLKQEGTSVVYIIHGGTKRVVAGNLLNTAKQTWGKRDISDLELAQIVDPEVLNEIPSGPNINIPEHFSIPLEAFDDPEEQTTTELTDLVEVYTFTLHSTKGNITIMYNNELTEVGLFPIPGIKVVTMRSSDISSYPDGHCNQELNNPLVVPVLKANTPTGKPFISIKNNTDDPIEDILDIRDESGEKVSPFDITESTSDSPFIPMHLEWGSSGRSEGEEDPDKYAGWFNGKKIETRLITQGSHRPYPTNEDVQKIFAKPVSEYYKWEIKVPNYGGSTPKNYSTAFSSNTARKYYGLYLWERVYGRPIYNFITDGDNLKWYWVKMKSVPVPSRDTRLEYWLELSPPGTLGKINESVKYEIMANGNYKFKGTDSIHSNTQQMIEVREPYQNGMSWNYIDPMNIYNANRQEYDNYFNEILSRATQNGGLSNKHYGNAYSKASANEKKRFINPELVYEGFAADPYIDARVAMVGPYDFT